MSLLALVLGGLLTYLFLPTKIETREVEKVVYKDKIIHQVKTITKDGTVTIVTDTHDKTSEISKVDEKRSSNLNSKRLLLYGGINPMDKNQWLAGISYNILGPIDLGAAYQSGVYLTVGIRF